MVLTGITGFLAEDVSEGALNTTLRDAIASIRSGADFRSSSRRFAEESCDDMIQAARYAELFQELGAH